MRNIGLWSLALVITLASAVYQKRTGPSYPLNGKTTMGGSTIDYELPRTHGGPGGQAVTLAVADTNVTATLVYRHYKTDDQWKREPCVRDSGTLTGYLPHQPPAGKLEYHLELRDGSSVVSIPAKETAVIRFKGAVPATALAPHIFFMFMGMLVSTRAGLEALSSSGSVRNYALWATGLIFAGGLILGPVVQKYAFGAFWTGIPFGMDLTDNKTLIAFAVWLMAIIPLLRGRRARSWVLAASIVTLVIFMIPHSMQGSELDYSTMEVSTS